MFIHFVTKNVSDRGVPATSTSPLASDTNTHEQTAVLAPKTVMLYALFAVIIIVVAADPAPWYSACAPAGSGWRALELHPGRKDDCLAWATFDDLIETTGSFIL